MCCSWRTFSWTIEVGCWCPFPVLRNSNCLCECPTSASNTYEPTRCLLAIHNPPPPPSILAPLPSTLPFSHHFHIPSERPSCSPLPPFVRLGHVKLVDFGLSKHLKPRERTQTICGTLQYMGELMLYFQKEEGCLASSF